MNDQLTLFLNEHEILKEEINSPPKLTVLSFGAGQDSFALLLLYIYSADFRLRYAPNDFLVVISDTGNEYPHTQKLIKQAESLCAENDIEFVYLTPEKGYHKGDWTSLTNFYEAKNTIGSVAFSKTCTDRLKIKPIYNFLEDYLCRKYDLPKSHRKSSFYDFYNKIGRKIDVLIGISKDEEKRVASLKLIKRNGATAEKWATRIAELSKKGELLRFCCDSRIYSMDSRIRGKEFGTLTCEDAQNEDVFYLSLQDSSKWRNDTVRITYPLLEMGITRKGAQQIIKEWWGEDVFPSQCKFCHFQSLPEILYLFRTESESWNKWVQLEASKLKKHKERAVNHGVYGAKNLCQKLEEALSKFGDLSLAELEQYRMNHSCVQSTY